MQEEETRPQNTERPPTMMRTFEDDIAHAVKDTGGSAFQIVMAEQKKREDKVEIIQEKKGNSMLLIFSVVLFIFAILGVGFVLYDRFGFTITPTKSTTSVYEHPLIQADDIKVTTLSSILPSTGIEVSLVYGLGGFPLNTKKITLVVPTTGEKDSLKISETNEILSRVAPHAPSILSRSLATSTAIGVYSGDTADTFLVFRTSSFEGALSGMLDYENFISDDLYTFMGVSLPKPKEVQEEKPVVKLATENNIAAKSLSMSTSSASTNASTTTEQSTSSSTENSASGTPVDIYGAAQNLIDKTVQAINDIGSSENNISPIKETHDINKFTDRTIKNRDLRVIEDEDGKIYFLYGFINRNTLIITTSVETFFEVASRVK